MCVCMYVYIQMHIYIDICDLCIYLHLIMSVSLNKYVHTYTYTYICMLPPNMYICIYICMYACIYIYSPLSLSLSLSLSLLDCSPPVWKIWAVTRMVCRPYTYCELSLRWRARLARGVFIVNCDRDGTSPASTVRTVLGWRFRQCELSRRVYSNAT